MLRGAPGAATPWPRRRHGRRRFAARFRLSIPSRTASTAHAWRVSKTSSVCVFDLRATWSCLRSFRTHLMNGSACGRVMHRRRIQRIAFLRLETQMRTGRPRCCCCQALPANFASPDRAFWATSWQISRTAEGWGLQPAGHHGLRCSFPMDLPRGGGIQRF